MTHPLLSRAEFPAFDQVRPDQIENLVDQLLKDNRARVAELLRNPQPDWASLMLPLEELDDTLSQAWSPISHLNAVRNNEELRTAYNACLPKISDYAAELNQNADLYQAFSGVAEQHKADLDGAQQMVLEQALRNFRLAGVDLPQDKKERFRDLQRMLTELTSRYSDNVLDATNAWSCTVLDVAELRGVPESSLERFRSEAVARDEEGYRIGLDFPSYYAIQAHAENRALREKLYQAYVTRASDQGPHAGQWDNTGIIDEIRQHRHELATLLGFEDYVAYSLATKMAESGDEVEGFLLELASRSRPFAETEIAELREFARAELGIDELQAWDVSFASERLRESRYQITEEEVRPWFPMETVLEGMFSIVKRLFGIDVVAVSDFASYHPDVRLFEVRRDGEALSWFYLDPFAREHKRGGAWMDEYRCRRRRADGSLQRPVAYLVCNFMPPSETRPALLTHDEVTTLFHEFGHGLHHMLTEIDYMDVSGINGVPWDAVELPSQFMENWCWERDALTAISSHYETGEPLPGEMLDKMLAMRNFQSGMQMLRQVEFSLLDLRLHANAADGLRPLAETQAEVRAITAYLELPEWNRYTHSFTHVFSGGYAAGYYSYKWAEVLSADAFSRFQEEGIFDARCGSEFRQHILARGGSEDPRVLFRRFRGRDPKPDALLASCGMSAP